MTHASSTHLDALVAGVREELESRKAEAGLEEVVARCAGNRRANRLTDMLARRRPGLIAEIKRASPSRGWIRQDLDAVATARAYARAGASAISVLTEGRRFGGSLADLRAVADAVPETPVLRKDFILDEYMLAEARAFGADMALLMVSVLGPGVAAMIAHADRFGLEALVEVHDEGELSIALAAGARIVGINNRNLKTLEVDLATSERLLPMIPPGVVKVVESGISSPGEVRRLAGAGADCFLVGEALVKSGDPGEAVRRLLSETEPNA
jgi:indole-3-glycerol phosphate synthase